VAPEGGRIEREMRKMINEGSLWKDRHDLAMKLAERLGITQEEAQTMLKALPKGGLSEFEEENLLKQPPYLSIVHGMLGHITGHKGIASEFDDAIAGKSIDPGKAGFDSALASYIKKKYSEHALSEVMALFKSGRTSELRELMHSRAQAAPEEVKRKMETLADRLQVLDQGLAEWIIKMKSPVFALNHQRKKGIVFYKVFVRHLVDLGLSVDDADEAARRVIKTSLSKHAMPSGVGDEERERLRRELERQFTEDLSKVSKEDALAAKE
jgi:hypothetical protein